MSTCASAGAALRLAVAQLRTDALPYHVGMVGSKLNLLIVSVFLLAAGGGSPTEPEGSAAVEAPPEAGYRVYITNEESGDLTVIDPATLEVVATAPLGKRPRGVHASPDGRTIYVALSGSPPAPPGVDESTLPPPDRSADGIGVFDVAENKLIKLIKSGTDPEEFALSKDGSLLYVSNEDAALTSIVEIATEKILKSLPVAGEPEGVTLTPDGAFVYVTSEEEGSIFVIDTAKAEVLKHFEVGPRPRSVAFLPDGSKGYVTLETVGQIAVVDAVKHELIKTIQLEKGNRPMKAIVAPDGSRAYVSTGRGGNVAVVDTTTDELVKLIPTDGARTWGIDISPDGRTIFTANGPSGDVSVIDVASGTVTKKIPAGAKPWGVLTLPR